MDEFDFAVDEDDFYIVEDQYLDSYWEDQFDYDVSWGEAYMAQFD